MKNKIDDLSVLIAEIMVYCSARKDFKALLDVAFASHLLFRSLPGAEEAEEATLGTLNIAVETLLHDGHPPVKTFETEPACSFCGRQRPAVELGAGPDVFICDGCVDIFVEVFREKKTK